MNNIKKISEWEIETPDGFKDFEGIIESKHIVSYNIVLNNKIKIRATEDHLFLTKSGIVLAKDLEVGNLLILKNGIDKIKSIDIIEEEEIFYDIINVNSKDNLYYANDITVHNCLYIDEMAFLPRHVQKEFMASTYPVITSGKNTKIIITSTPNGIGDEFHRLYKDGLAKANDFNISIYDYKWIPEHNNAEWKQQTITNLGSEERFKIEYECQFLASTFSVFDYHVLQDIEKGVIDPVFNIEGIGLKLYSEELKEIISNAESIYNDEKTGNVINIKDAYLNMAKKKKNRFITIDTSEGLGGDYAVANFMKFDLENHKIIQEGVLRSNVLDIESFASYVYSLAELLGNPFVFYENNNKSGGEFGRIFVNELGYNNVYYNSKRKEYGIRTGRNKGSSVKTFKTLIENNIFQINDEETFIELNYFEESPIGSGKFKASTGYTDDILMSLVVFCSVYKKEKDMFALLFGKGSVIDYMLNPKIEAEEEISDDKIETKIEKLLNNRINQKKQERLYDYEWEKKIYENMNIDLEKLQEAGVNVSFFKTPAGSNEKDTKNKNIFY
jgi:hypothetical protein